MQRVTRATLFCNVAPDRRRNLTVNEFRKVWHNITLEGAKHVRDHALMKALGLGVPISIVIVDRTGIILLMETADSAAPGSSEASIMKAKAAARYRIATH